MTSNAPFFWVALNLVKGIGAARMRMLLDAFGSAETAWNASQPELEAAGLNARLAQTVLQTRQSGQAEAVWGIIERQHIQVITWDDPTYPTRLNEIANPPPVLYVRGALTAADSFAVGIVGTRRATPYGRQAAEQLSRELAGAGLAIVSGLARGIDAAAHQAALNAGGRTLAVLGSGVDQIYPPEHRRMAEAIAEQGAVISDYPPGTGPEAANFPPRNRLIAGLSLGVIVVEAGEKSGALITADFAVEQGRMVFAVPGPIYAPQSRGTNLLIQHGGQLILSANDVVEMLHLEKMGSQREARAALPGDALEAHLYALLGREPLHVDEIGQRANLPIAQVSAALTMMELKGLVRQVGGMHYVSIGEARGEYLISGDD
jgi:DNA processing protein